MGCSMGCVRSKDDQSVIPAGESVGKKIRAAMLIQRWFRRYQARMESKRRATWHIFQSLEYSSEQDQLKLSNFFQSALKHTETAQSCNSQCDLVVALQKTQSSGIFDRTSMASHEEELLKLANVQDVVIPFSYAGPHIKLPLTTKQINDLLQAFKDKHILHLRYVMEILFKTRHELKKLPTVQYITMQNSLTIVGDLHGKYEDLLLVFYKNGVPSNDNPYLFNGDYVDRGLQSVEVALLLFSFFLMYPGAVFLNRGNHEDHEMNLRYGFIKEVMKKYKDQAFRVITLFEDVFSWLPLASVVGNEILVTHGGISDQTDLIYLNSIQRNRYISVLRPPVYDEYERQEIDTKEWRQVLDVLWSDPKAQDGCEANTFRGGGTYFGPDISAFVLQKHNLKLLVRSHECKIEGYEYCHNNQVLTVFSASNYYEDGSNKGAYVKLANDLQPRIVQFMVSKFTNKTSQKQRLSVVEESAVKALRERICVNKTRLLDACAKLDPDSTGHMTIIDWCAMMRDILELDVPWRSLKNQLVKTDDRGIEYATMFDSMALEHKLKTKDQSLEEILYRHRDDLETIFRAMDKDNSGVLSMQEFADGCKILNKYANTKMNEAEIKAISQSLDINKDGHIDFNEFLEAFRISDQHQAQQ